VAGRSEGANRRSRWPASGCSWKYLDEILQRGMSETKEGEDAQEVEKGRGSRHGVGLCDLRTSSALRRSRQLHLDDHCCSFLGMSAACRGLELRLPRPDRGIGAGRSTFWNQQDCGWSRRKRNACLSGIAAPAQLRKCRQNPPNSSLHSSTRKVDETSM
jgi:hypothetical protein